MFRLVIFSCLFLATFADSKSLPTPSEGRIVGGHDTDITEVPYQVSVQYNGSHRCGGSIIGPKHILTANHCVRRKNPTLLSIRAGSNYYNKDGQVVEVDRVVPHPKYNGMYMNNDAAVLVLKEPLQSGEGVQIATLTNEEPEEGDMILISGWGLVEGNKRADSLQSVSLPVVSKTFCKTKYHEDSITDQMFCAGYPKGEKDSCRGDSGGPAVVNGKLAGIVSWGAGCGQGSSPGVYTNVAGMLPWISTEIQK